MLAGHLTVNTLIKFQRGSLGLNNTTPLSSHVFNFALLQTRSSAQRPPFHTLILPQPYETLHVTDCRSHSVATSLLYAFPFAVPNMPFTNLVPDCLRHCSCQVHLHVLVAEHIPSVLIHLLIIAVRVLKASAPLPRSYLHLSNLASTARLSVRPSSYLPFA